MEQSLRNISDPIRRIGLPIVAFAAILVAAFSPIYGVAYLIAVAIATVKLPVMKAFSSYFARFVIATLILAAVIMLIGLLLWIIQQPLYAPVVVVSYLALCWILNRQIKTRENDRFFFFDKGDVVSLALSIIAPLILLSSFGISSAGILQVANEGWDNGAHVIMLEDASKHNSYLYGPLDALKEELVLVSNAYPQAWHLATANMSNGFGSNLFQPNQPIQTMFVYVIVLIIWMVLASYCFAKICWHAALRFGKTGRLSGYDIVLFCVVNVIIQMVVIWGSFVSGFSNYIAMLAYLCLLLGIGLEQPGKNLPAFASMGILFASAATVCWFLPAPALLFVAFALPCTLASKRLVHFFRLGSEYRWLYRLTGVFVTLSLLQIAIFMLFSTVNGGNQLNAGIAVDALAAVNGVFPVSYLFFAIMTAFVVFYWLFSDSHLFRDKAIVTISIVPFVLLVIFLYGYQMITTGETSYYLPKLMGVALIPIGLFVTSGLIRATNTLSERVSLSKPWILLLTLTTIGLVILGTNQSLFGAEKLLQRNARVNLTTAGAVVEYLQTADHDATNIIVLRDQKNKPYEDINGKFESRVVNKKLNCSYKVTQLNDTLDKRLKRLAICADSLADKGRSLVIVTSNSTLKRVKDLNKPNILIKNIE